MNWLEKQITQRGITCRHLSKHTGMNERYLEKIIDDDIPLTSLKHWQALTIIEYFEKTKDTTGS